MLDSWLYGESPTDMPGLHSYWESSYNEKDDDIAKYDVQMTFYQSFARHVTRKMAAEANCLISPIWKAKEVTYYMQRDKFKGVLVKFDAKIVTEDGAKIFPVFEAWANKINTSVLYNKNMSEPGNRLKGLEVSFIIFLLCP